MGTLTSGNSNRSLVIALVAALVVVISPKAHANVCSDLFKAEGPVEVTMALPKVPARAVSTTNMTPKEDVKPQLELLAELSELGKTGKTDSISVVLGETRSLLDFLTEDSSKNLAVQAPFTVMNAAQRMLALIYSQGKQSVRRQLTGEPIEVYPFFSGGLPLTNGFRVVGNEVPISEFVNNLKAQASGDRSGSSIILLVGSHGTGKSETLKLLSVAAEKLTSQEKTEFASYTYKWKNLGDIAELQKYVPTTEVNGKRTYADIEAPLGDSPFTLFPTEVQSLILAKARNSAEKLIDGMTPAPFATPDPISQFIRNEIIQHYTRIKGSALTVEEIVMKLAHHVEVKRQILGQAYNRMPLIDAQGNDIDVAGLFMAPNPVVRFASGAGPTHVMSWYLNGKILSGHGNAVLLDEFFRNPQELRDMLLGAFESRRLTVGGAPTVPFDAVMIAATNTANLDKVRQDKAGAAAADRFKITPARWSVFPNEIAQLLLTMKSSELRQQSLSEEGAPVTRANINDLLPRVEGNTRIVTPDYRYRIFFGEGARKVEVAPHTIMLMSEIISATRMELDPNKAEREFKGKILGSNLLRSPIDRLKLYEGTKPEVQPDEIRELVEVGILLKEGESGISARDAGRWLTAAIEAAANDRTGYTLTPGVLLRTFRKMLSEGSITSPSTKERLRWMELGTEVVQQMLLPRLNQDISRALANGDRVVNDAYRDFLDESFVLDNNPNATSYISERSGQERPIDRERRQAIEEIYRRANGRPLNISQISIFHTRQKMMNDDAPFVPDSALLDAIATYYAKLNTKIAGFQALVEYERTGTGTDDVKSAHASLVSALRAMGYNEVAIRDALMLLNDQKSRSQPVEQ